MRRLIRSMAQQRKAWLLGAASPPGCPRTIRAMPGYVPKAPTDAFNRCESMTYFELAWITWACAGDITALGLQVRPIPDSMRPLAAAVSLGRSAPVCRAVIEIERPLNRTAAERLIKEIGPTAAPSLRWCERFRCWPRKIIWGESLTVDGRKI